MVCGFFLQDLCNINVQHFRMTSCQIMIVNNMIEKMNFNVKGVILLLGMHL